MDIEVKVICRSSSERVVCESPLRLKAYLTLAPEKGKANKALIDLLSRHFGVRKTGVNIKKGLHSNLKVVSIPDL